MTNKMTTDELRDLLVPTHIYYDVGTNSLKDRALGEIITKILYLQPDKKARFGDIQKFIIDILGIPSIPNQNVQSGLEFLKRKCVVVKQGKFWFLSKQTCERVANDLIQSEKRIEHILDKHFGTKIDRPKLTAWFKKTAANFYGKYGEILSKRLIRQDTHLPSEELINSLLTEPTTSLGLEEYQKILSNGFHSFLKDSIDPIINQQIWSFAQAMLSAKLVSASIGVDPISINEFRDSKLFLDTNVLFIASLEKSRLSKALLSLGAGVAQIGATFHVIHETKEEYKKVVVRKREEALRVVAELPLDVIEDARDMFIKTALGRGCVDVNSFSTFFENIKDIPDSIGGAKVNLEDYEDTRKACTLGTKDEKRKNDISSEWKRVRGYSKATGSIIHDSCLDAVADSVKKKGEKVWIITLDSTMQNLAVKWAGENIPTWIGLDTLIQLLAISSGGPSHEPQNFVLLLNTVITNDVYANDKVFTLEDLDSLLDLEERIKELSKEDMENFASKMANLRMKGRPKGDSELQLEIRRTFQRKKMNSDEATKQFEKRASDAEIELSDETKKRSGTESVLLGKIIKEEKLKFYVFLILKILFLLVVGFFIVYLGWRMIIKDQNAGWGWLLISFGIVEILMSTIKWFVSKLTSAKKVIESKSIDKLKSLLKN